MPMSRRASWWAESFVLFVVLTVASSSAWHFLFARGETWPKSLLRGAVFALGMLVMLSFAVRRRQRPPHKSSYRRRDPV